MKLRNKLTKEALRRRRTRKKVKAASFRPRLHVHRSNKHTYAQIIDDQEGKTLVSATEKELKTPKDTKLERAKQIGELIAKKAKDKKIKKVAFDRGSYKYHGRIQAVAEAAREKGLDF